MYGNHHTMNTMNSARECVQPPLDGKELLEMNVSIVGMADMLITMFM